MRSQKFSANNSFYDICSPSCTGLGLEILRTVPLIQAARNIGLRPRLWTFHPLAYDDQKVDLIPLAQNQLPLLPADESQALSGSVWMPHSHPNGPYVCSDALLVALERNFRQLQFGITDYSKAGAYPTKVAKVAALLGDVNVPPCIRDHPLYPADSLQNGEEPPIVVNLIGTNGDCKGLAKASLVAKIAASVGAVFSKNEFVFLLNSRVCSGQTVPSTSRNVRILMHLDSDSRVARLLHPNAHVITVEGGLAHAALYRGCKLTIIGLASWLNETAYLYPFPNEFNVQKLNSFSVQDFIGALVESIAHEH